MSDDGPFCDNWSDRKILSEIDLSLVRGMSAESPGLRLGYFAGARALLGILCDRASAEAKASTTP